MYGQKKKGAKSKKIRAPAKIYPLKISLLESEPLIWRRILVPGNESLGHLHEIIQIVMGWQDCHLHQFIVGKHRYTHLYPELDLDDMEDEFSLTLSEAAPQVRSSFVYEYDFGDSWQHLIFVEKVLLTGFKYPGYPICVDGACACPPEDCGGIWGYEHLLEVISNPEHEEHEEMLEWIGEEFDHEKFGIEQVNKNLKNIKCPC